MPQNVFDLFTGSVGRHASNVAMDFDDVVLTYEQTAEVVREVACRITRATGGWTGPVALIASRRLETYVGYLALLSAGCTVVPLSAATPKERADQMITACGCRFVLEDGDITRAEVDLGSAAQLPDGTAYVLFTSGSTGVPKGVPITHRNVLAYISWAAAHFEVSPESRLSQTFELTFDPSVFDMFAAWSAGAALVVPKNRELLLPAHYVNRRDITHWASVPSVISIAMRLGALEPDSMPGLRYSQFCGEQLTLGQARAWRLAAPRGQIDNTFGPTELTVTCASYRLPADASSWPVTSNDTVPIGTINDCLEELILDENGQPSGEGELVVRGPQRFGGYLDPLGNRSRFVDLDGGTAKVSMDPSAQVGQGLWYRTGDRVRREAGQMVHVGRLDRQVKLRGHRVELMEIEAALRRHPGVADAVVAACDTGQGLVLGAVLAGTPVPDKEISASLRERLPEYMLPARYSWVNELPRGRNGKVDQQLLGKIIRSELGLL